MSNMGMCPGLYCGFIQLENDEWSDCGPCPGGYQKNATSYCVPCTDEPNLYDWQYLGFMVMVPFVLHWFFIELVTFDIEKKNIIMQHISALVEIAVGSIGALLVLPPVGSLRLYICPPKTIPDWYMALPISKPGYIESFHCAQEAEYILYTIVLVVYAFSLIMTMILRPLLFTVYSSNSGKNAVYCALCFYSILVLIHTVASGLIYFWYLLLIPSPSLCYIITEQFSNAIRSHSH